MTEEFKEGRWVKLTDAGLKHFRTKAGYGWNETMRAVYLGKSEKYPDLIKLAIRGQKRAIESHPKFWEPT